MTECERLLRLKQIDSVLSELSYTWSLYPDLRLGQLLHELLRMDVSRPNLSNVSDIRLNELMRRSAAAVTTDAPTPCGCVSGCKATECDKL